MRSLFLEEGQPSYFEVIYARDVHTRPSNGHLLWTQRSLTRPCCAPHAHSPGVVAAAAALVSGCCVPAISPPSRAGARAWPLRASISVLICATASRKLVFCSWSRRISADGKLWLISASRCLRSVCQIQEKKHNGYGYRRDQSLHVQRLPSLWVPAAPTGPPGV